MTEHSRREARGRSIYAAYRTDDPTSMALTSLYEATRYMSDIYAMRRANGDWFAVDDNGRFRVPLFRSSGDAIIARSRNFGMLLFKPVALNARRLEELVPESGGSDVDLCLVDDPFASLSRGRLVEHAQLAFLIAA